MEYLLEGVLTGQQDRLKESILALEVFGRSSHYDPKADPIVRVEMRRLRSKLSEYYLSEGQSDDVLIWLDKGSYVPLFAKRLPTLTGDVPLAAAAPPVPSLSQVVDIAPASPVIVVETSASSAASLAPSPSPHRKRLLLISFAAAAVLCGLFLLFRRFGGPSNSVPYTRLSPLTGNAGYEIDPAFSADGRFVAYAWNRHHSNFDIYVKLLAGGVPRRLTDSAAHDIHPAWSPDGTRIAFLRIFPEKSQLVVIPATSGTQTILCEDTPPLHVWHPTQPEGLGNTGPVWSPDGQSLLLASGARLRAGMGILQVTFDGHQQLITHPPIGMTDGNPSIAPSGRYIAFVRGWAPNSRDLFLLDARDQRATRLTFDSRDLQGVTWLDENHLLYSSNRSGTFRLWQINRRGGEPQLIPNGTHPKWPSVSSDGRRLAFTESSDDAEIWRLPLSGTDSSREAEPFLSSAGSDHSPAYSPDGKKIVFVSSRSGKQQLWMADSDGAEVHPLIDFPGTTVGSPHWSPDSQHIAFDGSRNGQSAIWLVDADGQNLHRLNNISVREYLPAWSHDGQWIYFLSLRSGSEQLWRQSPETGESSVVSPTPLLDVAESPEQGVFFAQRPHSEIWQMPLRGGSPQPVPELTGVRPYRYWTLAGQKLYFVRQEKPPRRLSVLDLKTRLMTDLLDIPSSLLSGTPGLSVDPSSHRLLFVQESHSRSTIMLEER